MVVKVKELLANIEHLFFCGDNEVIVSKLIALGQSEVDKDCLFWCSDKNKELLIDLNCGTILISQSTYDFVINSISKDVNCIVVENPRLAFMNVLNSFFVKQIQWGKISKFADIDLSVSYNESTVSIGSNVVLESGVVLGDNVQIGHNTVIKTGTIIGDNVNIGSNNTIGGVGFGYEMNKTGVYEFIPHIGNVVIENNVDIGNNTCIDRAVLGSTVIGEHVKIDNLVHIAHGVKIGKNSLIIANTMVAGSVVIGENVWVSPSCSIMQKVEINDDSLVGMGSVVLKNVEQATIVAGVPAKKIKNK